MRAVTLVHGARRISGGLRDATGHQFTIFKTRIDSMTNHEYKPLIEVEPKFRS
jgi:hypothetical protein